MTTAFDHRRLQGSDDNIWVLGVCLIIVGSLGNNLGNNLVSLDHKQKKAYEEEAKRESEKEAEELAKSGESSAKDVEEGGGKETTDTVGNTATVVDASTKSTHNADIVVGKPEKKFSWRTIGVSLFVIGNLATFASFGFAAQSLLASLESIQFVSNVFFVRYVHKEKVTWRMIIATTSIVVGNSLVVIFSDHTAALLTSADLINLYATNEAYWVYLAVALLLWAVNHFTYAHYYNARVNKKILLWRHSFVEPFTFAVSSAIIGTQAVLNSKCMSMLIQVSSRGIVNEFTLPHIWWILVTWLILVAYWLRRLDKGLELFPPLFIIPVMQVFFVFFAILCGGIYFQEFLHFEVQQFVGFIIGVLMILAGVFGLAPVDDNIVPPPTEAKIGDVDSASILVAGGGAGGEADGSDLAKLAGVGGDTQTTTPAVSDKAFLDSFISDGKSEIDNQPFMTTQTTPPPASVPQLVLGLARSSSGLTESPTTLDSPMRLKPTAVALPTTAKTHVLLSSPSAPTPHAPHAHAVVTDTPKRKDFDYHPADAGEKFLQDDDSPYRKVETRSNNRRVVKRGTTPIDRYGEEREVGHAPASLPPVKGRPGVGGSPAPSTPITREYNVY